MREARGITISGFFPFSLKGRMIRKMLNPGLRTKEELGRQDLSAYPDVFTTEQSVNSAGAPSQPM